MQPAWQSPHPTVTVTVQPGTVVEGVTSYQQQAPMSSGDSGPTAANIGSDARTSATACAGEVISPEPDGEGVTVAVAATEGDGPTAGEGGAVAVGVPPHAVATIAVSRVAETILSRPAM